MRVFFSEPNPRQTVGQGWMDGCIRSVNVSANLFCLAVLLDIMQGTLNESLTSVVFEQCSDQIF